jgi:predicted O-methyltransferase YrrM
MKQSHLYNENKIKFEINDTYNNLDSACKARLDLFNLPSVTQYDKILYLDTDILVKDDINKVFDVCTEDTMYVLEEGWIDHSHDYWGNTLFGDEINNYDDKTAFTSGILLLNNCEKMHFLFNKIKEDIINRPYYFTCYDQPYIIYNAFKYNLYNNKVLKSLVVNSDSNIHSDKVIHHFPGGPGVYHNKIDAMTIFLNSIKDFVITNNINKSKEYINSYLLPIIHNCGELLEGNILMIHHTTTYTDVYLNKAKNISNLVLNQNIKNVMEIGFNAGFSTLLMLLTNPNIHMTCFDLGEHKYTKPCYEKLKEIFGERISIVIGDSTKTLQTHNEVYDLIHIDGGHSTEVAQSDIINSYRLSKQGTILIMDDYDFSNLHKLWDSYIVKYNLKPLHINTYVTPHHDIKYVSTTNISKVLFQTNKITHNTYVLNMINSMLSPEWKYEFYNDADIIQFFINNPIADLPDIIHKYNSMKCGAHRADLFRYYYLYVNGGFFMDSDAMLYVNIDTIVKNYSFVSVNSSCHPGAIFQGILGASPKNKIIKKALYDAYNTDPNILDNYYHYFCKKLYDIIQNNNFGYNIKLYQERRENPDNGDDILDGETLLFKHYWKDKVIPNESKTQYTSEFIKIYNTNYWIKGSGAGSYIENTIMYNKFITDFIKNNNISNITDVGCGDWQSTYLIYEQFDNIDYVGLDCVDFIIEQNKENHPKYNFYTLDILCNIDLIRDSELYIIKDVLQHWKLKDIYDFLDKLVLKNFKYIIITNNGNQTYDDLELNDYIGNGRGLHSNFLPLKKYNAELLLEYNGGEIKHMCIIRKQTCFIKYTDWNNYNKSELNNFDYRILNTYTVPNKLIRVGPKADGGYVIADGLEYDLFISCGIANDIRFEEDFLDIYKVKCIAFDGTIQSFPSNINAMEWIPKNIGFLNTDKTTNLKEYIQCNKRIFLKMDIEGSEFNWLESITESELDCFSQIVLEVHWPFDIYRMNLLNKLNKTHYIIHIHGNNYCDRDIPKHLPSGRTYDGTVTINNPAMPSIRLPEVFEVTYINKKLCNNTLVELKEIQFPTAIDYPNNPNAEDIYFSIPFFSRLDNKKYTWEHSYIKFLNNFKMDAFGNGHYTIIDKHNIIAYFGGRVHNIRFNDDYTAFSSTRQDDSHVENGTLIIEC